MIFKDNLRWVLIFWMFLMSSIAYLYRVNVSIAGGVIQKDYGLTNIQLGYVFSAFVIGYALFQAPGGRLADRFGPRLIIMIGVIWWSLFTTLTTMVPVGLGVSIALLILVRFLLGLGEAVVYPVVETEQRRGMCRRPERFEKMLVAAVNSSGARAITIYDDAGRLRLEAVGSQPPRLLPYPSPRDSRSPSAAPRRPRRCAPPGPRSRARRRR